MFSFLKVLLAHSTVVISLIEWLGEVGVDIFWEGTVFEAVGGGVIFG